MVKFGKYFRRSKIEEWADKYIDYKKLKKKIKEICVKVVDTNTLSGRESLNNDNNDSLEYGLQIPRETINISFDTSRADLGTLYSRDANGVMLREFIDMLDKEFKKVYVFFVSMEKELYVQINSHLYIQNSLHTFTLQELKNELDSLTLTVFLARSLKRFINDNTTAIKKILKKFDKKLRKYYGYVSIKYLSAKLNVQNSDLEYMLQFKVIDETNTLIENILRSVKKEIKRKKDNSNPELNRQIKEKIEEINGYIITIDKKSEYQIKYKEWFYYIRQGEKIIKNNPQHLSNDIYNPLISSNMINDTLILKLLSERALYRLETRDAEMSRVNVTNITLCFIHVFLYMFSYTVIVPSGYMYCKYIKKQDFFCLIWGLMPFCAIFSMLLFEFFKDNQYKISHIVSICLMMSGNLIYTLSFKKDKDLKYNLIFLCLSRALIGLGSNPLICKKYITQFTTKSYLPSISLGYIATQYIAFALGPVVGVILYFPFNEDKHKVVGNFRFDYFTFHAWFLICVYLIFLFLIIFMFTSPTAVNFDINEEKEEKIDYGGVEKGLNYIAAQHGTRPLISTDEKKLINEIDDKLNEYNEKNEFSDTNQIPVHLKMIINQQKSCCSYLGKAMLLSFSIFLFSRIVNESFTLMLILRIDVEKEDDYVVFLLVLISCLLLEAIVSFISAKLISIKSRTRKLLVSLLIINFAVSLAMLIQSFFKRNIVYYILYYIVVLATILCEIDASNLIANIMPPRMKICGFEYGILISNSILIGRVIGCLFGFIYYKVLDKVFKKIKGHKAARAAILAIVPFVYLTLLFLVYLNYNDLRIKAISRILRSHYLNKLN